MRLVFAALTLAAAGLAATLQAQPAALAIVGATLIDGNGGAPVHDGVLVVTGTRLSAIGPRGSTTVPAGARIIDGAGKFVVPGFTDTNVHLSLYGGMNDRYETLVRYWDRQPDIVLEAAQIQLRYGVMTVRDSYGMLRPLTAVRDRIASGGALGARILAAGNILGWSGPYSVSFSLTRPQGLTLFQEQMNDEIAQGGGEELMGMTPAALGRAIDAYIAKGPDFLKYGGTSHFSEPTFIGFSPEAQKTIVEHAHAHGRFAETHATSPEGLRIAIGAGIDGIQHPEMVDGTELPDDLIARVREKGIVCSMLVSTITGEAWEKHL
jgi:imidazolonepropionase-like amidohydrolase